MGFASRVVYCLPSAPTPAIAAKALDALPANLKRSSQVHSLVRSYDLLEEGSHVSPEPLVSKATTSTQVDLPLEPLEAPDAHSTNNGTTPARARVLKTGLASRKELEAFHEKSFVDFLLSNDPHPPSPPPSPPSRSSDPESDGQDAPTNPKAMGFSKSGLYDEPEHDDIEDDRPTKRIRITRDEISADFGLADDCPPFALLATYVRLVAGASLAAARELREDRADIAIAWDGGRHHAHRAQAKGFCYVNDAVLAILELRRKPQTGNGAKIDRVMYIDIDIHHGDGVEAAFYSSPRVLTFSLHLYAPEYGFFPLSGALASSGPPAPSPSAALALNAALLPNLSSNGFLTVVENAVIPLLQAYDPGAVVVQCGLDGLVGDPSGKGKEGWSWRLDLQGIGKVVETICEEARREGARQRKILLLGGGGYSSANAARGWAYLTSVALGRPLDLSSPIPQDDRFFSEYGPSFALDVPASANVTVDENGSLEEGRLQKVVDVMRQHADTLRRRYAPKR